MNKFSNGLLYLLVVLIWGSTWLAVKFQLGEVAPLVSIIYRFGLASLLLFVGCFIARIPLAIPLQHHRLFLLQGLLLFGFNYWLIYKSQHYLTSGLVACAFSLLVFFNSINGRIFIKSPINLSIIFGGVIGLSGMLLLFYPEVSTLSLNDEILWGICIAISATYVASLGNIVTMKMQHINMSIFAINAWGMLYGTLAMATIAGFSGMEFNFEMSTDYIASLLYLSIFGSIIAFVAYMKLMHQMGADKAAYTTMLFPAVALPLSTIFEQYQWTMMAVAGFVLIFIGNAVVIRNRKPVIDNFND